MSVTSSNNYNALILIVLLVLGRFISKSIRCETKSQLTNNIWVRNAVIYTFIVMSLSIRQKNIKSILSQLLFGITVLMFALMFVKLNAEIMLLVLVLLCAGTLLNKTVEFDHTDDDDDTWYHINRKTRKNIVKGLRLSAFITLFLGFSHTLYKERKNPDFNLVKYVFGGESCYIKKN